MVSTTKDEQNEEVPVVVSKSFTKGEVNALYIQGKNIYEIAREVYGFDNEDAVDNIRRILGKEDEVSKRD